MEEPHFEEVEIPLSPVFGSPKEERLWEYPVIHKQPVRVLTRAYPHSLSQLPIFHSLPLTTKRKPRIFPINEETSAAPSLEDIVLESLQSINTPWEEIPEDSPSESNPWSNLDPNGENLNQHIPLLDMANIPQGGGNKPPPPPRALPPWLTQDAVEIPGKQPEEYPGSSRL